MTAGDRQDCEVCRGRGYTVRTYSQHRKQEGVLKTGEAHIICLECHGTGKKPYDGDRSGTAWEGE